MRIAIVETQSHGGLLQYAVQLAESLAARGHTVDLLAPRDNEVAHRASQSRMRAVLTPTVRSLDPPRAGRLSSIVRRARVAARLSRSWARILLEVRRGRYDVALITADILRAPAALGALLVTWLRPSTRTAHVAHNARMLVRSQDLMIGDDESLTAKPPIASAFLGRAYPRFVVVFVHGEATRADFDAAWPGARLVIIPHGDERIFGDEPPPPSAEEEVLFFGSWHRSKGIEVLTRAFDELALHRPLAKLTIAGMPSPDVDIDRLRRWADGHRGRVRLIDRYVPLEEVPPLFAAARVVTTPYLAGYQSGVVHLAMTMSRAVVSSDVGDLGTAVTDGASGLLVTPGDIGALAEALERLLADPDLANRMGAAGRERMLGDSAWERVAERVERALDEDPRSH